jgi:hypothetical protein
MLRLLPYKLKRRRLIVYVRPSRERTKMTIGRFTFDLLKVLVFAAIAAVIWTIAMVYYLVHYHPLGLVLVVGFIVWRVTKRKA